MSTKKIMDDIYRTQKQFNITKMVEKEFNESGSTQKIKHLLKEFDFSQISKVEYTIEHDGRPFTVQNEQTLAHNFISTLPLNIYKEYVTPQWIRFKNKSDSNHGMAEEFIKNIEFLNLISDIGYKKENNLQDKTDYDQYFLKHVLNITHNINKGDSQEYFKDYLNLFYKCKSQKDEINQDLYKSKPWRNDWFLDLKNYDNAYHRQESLSDAAEFLVQLASIPISSPIFLDCLSQIKNQKSDPINQIMLKNGELITGLLEGFNLENIKASMEIFNLSLKDFSSELHNNLISFFKVKSQGVPNNIPLFFSKEIQQKFNYLKTTSYEKSFQWLYGEDDNIKTIALLPTLVLLESPQVNAILAKEINWDKPIFNFSGVTPLDFNAKDFALASCLMTDYCAQTLNEEFSFKRNFAWNLGNELKNLKNLEFSKENHDKAFKICVNYMLKESPQIKESDLIAFSRKNYLNETLEKPDKNIKKIKI